MRRGGPLAALLLAATVSAACGSGGEPTADIKLDGTRRDPDVEGTVTRVTLDDITVDGKRYELSRNLLAFNTYTLVALPVLGTEGSYVHLGIESDEVVWLAEVAKVLPEETGPTGFYRGTLVAVDDGHLVFQDGTVLRSGPGLAAPEPPVALVARIDVDHDRVVAIAGA